MEKPQLEKLCYSTRQLVAEVASFIKKEVGKVETNSIEVKSKNSLVSYVDKTAKHDSMGQHSLQKKKPLSPPKEPTNGLLTL